MNLEQYREINRAMSQAWHKCQHALDMAGIPRVIDEMSVLLTPEELRSYREWAAADAAVGGGLTQMEWFNGVDCDSMHMEKENGNGPVFQVRFEFFRPRVDGHSAPWRVEAMAVLGGFAPLHSDPTGRVVHASYKCASVEEYEIDMRMLAISGLVPIAHYRNAYGRFSYFENGDFPWSAPDRPLYLKPRVNLRDAG